MAVRTNACKEVAAVITRRLPLLAFGMLLVPQPDFAHAAFSLASLSGQWRGSGQAYFTNGQTEKIRCRANYAVNGSNLNQTLRCASARLVITLSSGLIYDSGRLSGNWQEINKGGNGQVWGNIRGNNINLEMSGSGRRGSLVIGISGCSQTIRMNATGGDVSRVSIRLRKSPC